MKEVPVRTIITGTKMKTATTKATITTETTTSITTTIITTTITIEKAELTTKGAKRDSSCSMQMDINTCTLVSWT